MLILICRLSGGASSGTATLDYDRRKVEGDPIIYIVTMLIVFSAGIASLMIIYMKKVEQFSSKKG